MDLTFNFTTDHHFSHRNPGSRQGDYFSDLSSKMLQVATYCNANKSVPLFGGDLFHLKDPAKIATLNLTSFLGDMGSLLSHFDVPPLCAVGNHDIRFDRMSTLPEQPLGVMHASRKVQILCPFIKSNLRTWEAPSGLSTLVPSTMPAKFYPSGDGSHIMVYSTPYLDDPQDLVAYLESSVFHESLQRCVSGYFGSESVQPQTLTCILLLHTLAGPTSTEFFGLWRASYQQIFDALSLSAIGRTTSAVLFGHEHPELGNHVLSMKTDLLPFSNLPLNVSPATGGTVFMNPGAFSRSSLDRDSDGAERQVCMTELRYTPVGMGLSLSVNQIPLVVKPLVQVYGNSVEVDPLNQEGVDLAPTSAPTPTWTSFSMALHQINEVSEKPDEVLALRLQSETPQVVATVHNLLQGEA